jgi:hypothetical protein
VEEEKGSRNEQMEFEIRLKRIMAALKTHQREGVHTKGLERNTRK